MQGPPNGSGVIKGPLGPLWKKMESTFRIKIIKVKIMKKREKRCHSIQKTMSFSQTDYVVVN